MPADLPDLARNRHADRVNLAIDHAVRHLAEPLRLMDLAQAAGFSPYHFHRLFKYATGETVAAFVKRVRLERALYLMSHRPGLSLTRVALECGFASSSDFSRSFRARYGVAPSALDVSQLRDEHRAEMLESLVPQDRHRLTRLPPGANPDGFAVELRRLPARRVAYIRVLNPYSGGVYEAAQRLMAWAEAHGLADGRWLGYQWEDPEIVPLEQCRYDVAVEVPPGTRGAGDISLADFPPSILATLDIDGPVDLELRALDWLYGTWLPGGGYVPDHQPVFEAWHGRPFADGPDRVRLSVQLAVVPA